MIYIPLDKGPKTQTPKRIIVHAMSEWITDSSRDYHAIEFLRKIGLSAHVFITPTGLNLRSRHDNQGAWHAKGNNVDTLGIEFLVPGLHDYASFINAIKSPYLSGKQYQAGLKQVRQWINDYDIDVYRHSDIDPNRKKDPGDGFDWNRFIQDVFS